MLEWSGGDADAPGAASAVPHSSQKRWSARTGAAQLGQARASKLPHSAQNLAVGLFSLPQFPQVTSARLAPEIAPYP